MYVPLQTFDGVIVKLIMDRREEFQKSKKVSQEDYKDNTIFSVDLHFFVTNMCIVCVITKFIHLCLSTFVKLSIPTLKSSYTC